MIKYECPHCHKKTITVWHKLTAGNMNKVGKTCPECGHRCVNGIASTICYTVMNLVLLIFLIYQFATNHENINYIICSSVVVLLITRLVAWIFNLFSKLTESIRIK